MTDRYFGKIAHIGEAHGLGYAEIDGGTGIGMIGTGEAELRRGDCWPPKIGMAVTFERGTFGPNQISGATNVEKV
jgi:hypothetical protein